MKRRNFIKSIFGGLCAATMASPLIPRPKLEKGDTVNIPLKLRPDYSTGITKPTDSITAADISRIKKYCEKKGMRPLTFPSINSVKQKGFLLINKDGRYTIVGDEKPELLTTKEYDDLLKYFKARIGI